MDKLSYYIKEYVDCILWILKEPSDPTVEYPFYRMSEMEKELREYVNKYNEKH